MIVRHYGRRWGEVTYVDDDGAGMARDRRYTFLALTATSKAIEASRFDAYRFCNWPGIPSVRRVTSVLQASSVPLPHVRTRGGYVQIVIDADVQAHEYDVPSFAVGELAGDSSVVWRGITASGSVLLLLLL